MIKRLRPKYSDAELAEIYKEPHDHSIFPDHILRVDSTLELAGRLLNDSDLSGADLSCGNAYILDRLPLKQKFYGDYARKYEFCGPLDKTLTEIPDVDVYVFCETIEHLDEPLATLKQIRRKAKKLILSTPLSEFTDGNPEHYWGWDRDGIEDLLTASGWKVVEYEQTLPPLGYVFQIHGAIAV